MAPDPAVELLLPGRHLVGRQATDVEQLLAAGQPRHGGVAAPVDRSVEHRAGLDVQHPEQGLLVTADRQLVGQPGPLLGRSPGVQRRGPRGVQRDRVEQQPFAAAGAAGPHRTVLLARLSA